MVIARRSVGRRSRLRLCSNDPTEPVGFPAGLKRKKLLHILPGKGVHEVPFPANRGIDQLPLALLQGEHLLVLVDDLLGGGEELRQEIESGASLSAIQERWDVQVQPFAAARKDFLIYPD